MTYTIKEAAKALRISPSALRYYDQLELMSPRRGENDYRYYTEEDIVLLHYLKVMKFAGFSLQEMKSIMDLNKKEPSPQCNERGRTLLGNKMVQINEKIEHLKRVNWLIEKVIGLVETENMYQQNAEEINEFIIKLSNEID